MKILFILTWYSNYNSQTIKEGIFHYEQAIALNKHDEVAFYFPFDNSINKNFEYGTENGILIFRRRNNKIKKYFNYIKDYNFIKNKFNPDIIHAHVAQEAGKIALLWYFLFHKSYIITEHAPIQMMNLSNKKNYLISKYVYKNSFKNICVSNDLCQKLKTFFSKQDFSVIFNGIPEINLEAIKNISLYKSNHKYNCVIIGSFYDKDIKGYQYLLPAIKEIVYLNKIDICLHVCGGGTFLDYYKTLASNLGISDNVIFYGHLKKTDVYNIIYNSDFVISSSIYESAGISVEEAMLFGKPLVVTKSGGANSLVTNDTAIIVDTESTKALSDGILYMISHINDYQSQYIKTYANNNFSMKSVTNQYLHLYKDFLNYIHK